MKHSTLIINSFSTKMPKRKRKTQYTPYWTKCPFCEGEAAIVKYDGSTMLRCFVCGNWQHIKLAARLWKEKRLATQNHALAQNHA